MAEVIYHEYYGMVTRPLLAAIRKYNVSPSDFDSLHEVYGNDYAAIKRAIETYTFQGMFSVFEFWNRRPL